MLQAFFYLLYVKEVYFFSEEQDLGFVIVEL